MDFLQPVTLQGEIATLVPLTHDHHAQLLEAVQDGELWKLWFTAIPSPEGMSGEIERRLGLMKQGSMLPFAVVSATTGRAVGMTTFMNIDVLNRRLEIGSTWYRRSVQRTGVNTEAKLLLLTHAFERLDAIAVEFRTHFFNHRSRAAIERLGARLDGILRQHQLARNGTMRDTCVYSILNREWPTVKVHLQSELSRNGRTR
jgi:RimJ/RimL family protein N-acetyltransferase